MNQFILILLMLAGFTEPSQVRNEAALKKEIRQELQVSGITCLDVGIAKSGCLWVFVLDNGKNRDGLATTLCSTAKRYSVGCVTILDSKASTLGRSRCQ